MADNETPTWLDPTVIDAMLDSGSTWAVVGLSDDQFKAAYSIAAELQSHGKKIVPVHPRAAELGEVLGEKVYPDLASIPVEVDVVDVFVRSELAGAVADQAVAIGAKGVWFQMGVVDEAAFERTTAAGVPMVMDICPSKVWFQRARAAAAKPTE